MTRSNVAAKPARGNKKQIEETNRGFNEAMQIQKEALA